jgi:hypothetical protein
MGSNLKEQGGGVLRKRRLGKAPSEAAAVTNGTFIKVRACCICTRTDSGHICILKAQRLILANPSLRMQPRKEHWCRKITESVRMHEVIGRMGQNAPRCRFQTLVLHFSKLRKTSNQDPQLSITGSQGQGLLRWSGLDSCSECGLYNFKLQRILECDIQSLLMAGLGQVGPGKLICLGSRNLRHCQRIAKTHSHITRFYGSDYKQRHGRKLERFANQHRHSQGGASSRAGFQDSDSWGKRLLPLRPTELSEEHEHIASVPERTFPFESLFSILQPTAC